MITIPKRQIFVHIAVRADTLLMNAGQANAMLPDSLFRSDEVIRIELKSNFTAILQERTVEPVAHKGILTYSTADGKTVKLNVEVTSRGNFRRDPANCDFPPLLYKFQQEGNKKYTFQESG
jgi:hypothetical protein